MDRPKNISKMQPSHLDRFAFIYVRQSTLLDQNQSGAFLKGRDGFKAKRTFCESGAKDNSSQRAERDSKLN